MNRVRTLIAAVVMVWAQTSGAAGPPEWFSFEPGARAAGGMAFDSGRGVAVMFGGTTDGSTFSDQTWELSGGFWKQRRIAGPSARTGLSSGMVYDSARGVTVLFGGGPPNVYLSDTWEYDGTAWVLRSVTGPSGRRYHAMAYDSDRHVTVLFGGRNATSTLGDTWEWDGTSWTQRMVAGPPSRVSAAMAYDSRRGVMVLFGGARLAPGVGESDTWEWDGSSWTQRMVMGPSARSGHAMVFDPVRGVVVLNGGQYEYIYTDPYRDSWEWDGVAWVQVGDTSQASLHGMVYDTARGVILRYGGHCGSFLDVTTARLWERRFGVWAEPVLPYSAPPSGFILMAYDSFRDRTVLLDAWGATWELSGIKWVQVAPPEAGPGLRSFSAMVYDSIRHRVVSFGGRVLNVGLSSETWEWDGAAWTLRASIGPARDYHSMAFDSDRGKTVLFGGYGTGGIRTSDTWEWDGDTWIQRAISGPPARSKGTMAYDSYRHFTVLYGGEGASGQLVDTWEWDGTTWLQRATNYPSGWLYDSCMAYDWRRRRTVFHSDSCWEWDGFQWARQSATGLGRRSRQAAAYDSARGAIVLVGGAPYYSNFVNYGGSRTVETMFLGDRTCLPVFAGVPAPATAAIGSQVVFTSAVNEEVTFRWRHNGLPLYDGPRHSGCTTPYLTISGISMADRGDYSVSASSACGTVTTDPVVLVVTGCYANCDDSQVEPLLNIADYICFIGRYAAGEAYANCDGSTVPPVLNVADFLCFQNRFAQGCP